MIVANRRSFLAGLVSACAAPAIVTPAGFRSGLWLPSRRVLTIEEFAERIVRPAMACLRKAIEDGIYDNHGLMNAHHEFLLQVAPSVSGGIGAAGAEGRERDDDVRRARARGEARVVGHDQ